MAASRKQLRYRWESARRYYAIRIYKDLLGDWVIDRAWGGLFNLKGNIVTEPVGSYAAAVERAALIDQERRARKYLPVN